MAQQQNAGRISPLHGCSTARGGPQSIVKAETDLNFHLGMANLAIFNMSARFHDLKPVEVFEGLGCPVNGIGDGIIDAFPGRTDKLDNLVYMIRHYFILMGCNEFLGHATWNKDTFQGSCFSTLP